MTYMDNSKYYVYGFAFGSTFIPTLAVFLNPLIINIKRITRNLYTLLVVTSICVAIGLVIFSEEGIFGIFSNRTGLIIQINGNAVNILNAITISFYGTLLSLSSMVILLFMDENKSRIRKLVLLLFFFLGLGVLLAGASRGPMITFIILFFIMILVKIIIIFSNRNEYLKDWRDNTRFLKESISGKRLNEFIILFIVIIILFVVSIYIIFHYKNWSMFIRMKEFIEIKTLSNEGRILLWQSAWEQIKMYPIFGKRFLTPFASSYSHNLILDSLMATGILGTILFLIYLFSTFYLFFKLPFIIKIKYLLIWTIFLAVLLLSMVSGGIWVASDFWILSALLIWLFSLERDFDGQAGSKISQ